ncbi:MAG: geranylgeranylglyceryl/heptaprenylglyceryl phosphate synthase [Thermofilaceae archaeon]|nr:geranylgeranylglyceryl/heptaprenylglyceryl phosphate synthase [Thermofilaceae archaeon]MCX8181186.1 geranylgeranylglyceryl/heptaprenylglyceryl phosphate synthase [Thermofilaceae archaeon]MDW8004473.1 geranylgeranylglyceryl/heptaprenylglyceryl phosphate synthase [Thermofilaceae archaeon]
MGRVEKYILDNLAERGALHMVLIDPARMNGKEAREVAKAAESAGTAAIMVGGSIGVSEAMVDDVVTEIKNVCGLPVILFPGTPTNLSRYADAVWFLSVLNSTNPYFIVIGQAQGAPIVKRYGLEPLSLAYLVLGVGGTVGFVSQARLIPYDRPEIAAAFALAAEYMGFRFLYLEGGSGGEPIPPHIIQVVDNNVSLPIIVGGGIRTPNLAGIAVRAGADIVITGTIVEEGGDILSKLTQMVRAINEEGRRKLKP